MLLDTYMNLRAANYRSKAQEQLLEDIGVKISQVLYNSKRTMLRETWVNNKRLYEHCYRNIVHLGLKTLRGVDDVLEDKDGFTVVVGMDEVRVDLCF
jgi:hypothetical protein